MDNNQQSNDCVSWRSVGIALGCVNIMESIGLGLFFIVLFGFYMGSLHVAIGILVIYGLNGTASVFWFVGIVNKKSAYLLGSLIWWAIPLCIVIFLAVVILINGSSELIDDREPHVPIKIGYRFVNLFNLIIIGDAAYGVIFYTLSVICYIKIKADFQQYTSEIPRAEVAYVTAPQFDIY